MLDGCSNLAVLSYLLYHRTLGYDSGFKLKLVGAGWGWGGEVDPRLAYLELARTRFCLLYLLTEEPD